MDIDTQIKALEESKRRRAQALKLFKAGKKYKDIGEALGVSRERARQLVAKAQQEAAPQG